MASLHTMRKETTPRQQATARVTQGCAVHLRQQRHPHGFAHRHWVPLGQKDIFSKCHLSAQCL